MQASTNERPLRDAEWLDPDEIETLTGVRQHGAQRRCLEQMGIHYFHRPDGRPIVSRWAIRQMAAGGEAPPDAGINWSAPTGQPDLSKVR